MSSEDSSSHHRKIAVIKGRGGDLFIQRGKEVMLLTDEEAEALASELAVHTRSRYPVSEQEADE